VSSAGYRNRLAPVWTIDKWIRGRIPRRTWNDESDEAQLAFVW
jgi:hypothetical protein